VSHTEQPLEGIPAEVAATFAAGMDHVPFGQWIGLEISAIEEDRVAMRFEMRDEFVGNSEMNVLHGGIISAALDTVGGLAALFGVLSRAAERSEDPPSPWLSTIDMRTDYLRPGFGSEFTASAFPLRVGGRSVVTRMELHNEAGDLIAVGTGTYSVP